MKTNFDVTSQIELLHQLREKEDISESNHAELELLELYDSVVRLVKSILTTCICSYGSGTIAGIIGNTRYTEIDKAINKTLLYLYHAEPEQLHDLQVDAAGIADIIRNCYHNKNL